MKKLWILLLIAGVALGSFDGKVWDRVHNGFRRHTDVAIYNAALGPSAPGLTQVETFLLGCFDSDAERGYVSYEVSADWIGGEDMDFKVYWLAEDGDALTDGETVMWVIQYRVIDFDAGEVLDSGTAVTDTLTYTQSGAGANLETHESEFILDYDHGDQPLTKGQVVGIVINRDMTADSYGGDACIERFEIEFTANDFSEH